jgi:hypothetical protein
MSRQRRRQRRCPPLAAQSYEQCLRPTGFDAMKSLVLDCLDRLLLVSKALIGVLRHPCQSVSRTLYKGGSNCLPEGSQSPTIMEQLPLDPQVTLLSTCQSPTCGQPMGLLRVYLGQGAVEKQHLCGSICQTWCILREQNLGEFLGIPAFPQNLPGCDFARLRCARKKAHLSRRSSSPRTSRTHVARAASSHRSRLN